MRKNSPFRNFKREELSQEDLDFISSTEEEYETIFVLSKEQLEEIKKTGKTFLTKEQLEKANKFNNVK
jgi:thiamine monophosphate kinase